MASRFKISPLVIGMTVVAFGTSAPELIVSLQAAMAGHPDIAIGNVVGSNIANVALVLGLTAMVIVLPVVSRRLFFDWFIMMLSYLALWIFMQDLVIERYEGIIMVTAIVLFTWFAIKKPSNKVQDTSLPIKKTLKPPVAIFYVVASCAGLAFGADLLVDSASEIAASMGVSERVISVTIVAFGTSVPELTASLVAAFKKETEISVGNIVGSNLFNVLVVLGITSIIVPIPADYAAFKMDMAWMVLLGVLLLLVIYPFKHNFGAFKMSRKWKALYDLKMGMLTLKGGILLVILYIAYIVLLF